jgi:hypothetical protein
VAVSWDKVPALLLFCGTHLCVGAAVFLELWTGQHSSGLKIQRSLIVLGRRPGTEAFSDLLLGASRMTEDLSVVGEPFPRTLPSLTQENQKAR